MKPKQNKQNQKRKLKEEKTFVDPKLNDLFKKSNINNSEVASFWENQKHKEFLFRNIKEESLNYEQADALGFASSNIGID